MTQIAMIEPPDDAEYPPVSHLPARLRFIEGFRNDAIVLARFSESGEVVTNLPVDAIPASIKQLCSNIAEEALLAYVIASGDSVQFAHLDYSVAKMQKLAREFAAKFLRPLEEHENTVVIHAGDFAAWFAWHARYGWGRSVRNPPGTEYG